MKPSFSISFFAALFIGLIVFGINTLLQLLFFKFSIAHSLLISLVVILVSGIIFHFLIIKYINEKIRLFYKKIFNINIQKQNSIDEKNKTESSFDNIDQDVMKWANEKDNEIKKLKGLELYRKEFIGNVSHELKTPIFTIQGYVYTLLDGGLEDDNVNRLYLEKTAGAIERMIAIVRDLEEISRLESGNMVLSISRFNITDICQDVFDHLELKAKKRKISISFEKNSDKPFFVVADKERIRQVITNLVQNSISYGVENGYTRLRFSIIEDKVLIEVIDNGIGIEPEDLPRIFERFYRCDKARSREHGGTGLGLAIVKHILEAHRQKINVSSATGIGTTFSFTLDKA